MANLTRFAWMEKALAWLSQDQQDSKDGEQFFSSLQKTLKTQKRPHNRLYTVFTQALDRDSRKQTNERTTCACGTVIGA
jgi:hypothetical protein